MRKTAKHVPTVKFLIPSVKNEAETFTMFLHEGDENWRSYIFKLHPQLCELKNVTNSEIIYKYCYSYVKKFQVEHVNEYHKAIIQNEKLWRPVEKKYLQTLSEHFEIEYPTQRKVMHAYVSIVPIYPRCIDEWSFNVSYFKPESVKEIACHEIQHFLYFEKWMEVFPKTKRRELDHPYLVWLLSELVAPVILNEHSYFKTLLNEKQLTYTNFQKIRIRGRQPFTHLSIMYRRHIKSRKSFENFLKDIWEFAKENEKILMAA